jgi:hypothetical protein
METMIDYGMAMYKNSKLSSIIISYYVLEV